MGQAIAYALKTLGHELVLIETNPDVRDDARAKWDSLGLDMPKWSGHFNSRFFHRDANKDIGLVISAAPYQANWPQSPDIVGNPELRRSKEPVPCFHRSWVSARLHQYRGRGGR
jgi:hypothetical protein